TVVINMPAVASSGAISAADFREWPVLDWIREDPRVQEAFIRVYGEPIKTGVVEDAADTKSVRDAELGKTGDDTESSPASPIFSDSDSPYTLD
ncbi:MAG: hypothetical protein WAV18_12445, partial [Roseiarcus sp.]